MERRARKKSNLSQRLPVSLFLLSHSLLRKSHFRGLFLSIVYYVEQVTTPLEAFQLFVSDTKAMTDEHAEATHKFFYAMHQVRATLLLAPCSLLFAWCCLFLPLAPCCCRKSQPQTCSLLFPHDAPVHEGER